MSARQPQKTRTSRRDRSDRRGMHPRPALDTPAARPAQEATARHRRGAGSEDRALYVCGCGAAFTAAVTTSVGCPSCGAGQAW